MARINPDPHEAGYIYQPSNRLTALLPAGLEVQPMLAALAEAGCDNEIDVFVGKQGAAKLDLAGKKHGAWVRFWRGMDDESESNQRAEKVLQSGGSIISVFTDKDADQKVRAVNILKNHHGDEITFWGDNAVERF